MAGTILKAIKSLLDPQRTAEQVTGTSLESGAKFALDVVSRIDTIVGYPSGESSVVQYGEVTGKAMGSWHTIAEYTVPASSAFYLMLIEASGGNISQFRVLIDSQPKGKKRSWWSDFNVEFDYTKGISGHEIAAGGKIEVQAYHKRPHLSDYEAAIIGVKRTLTP